MRPEKAIEQDKLNEAPPHIVVSLRFNNRQQDCMTTLCGGNILPDELDEEEMRASFIVSAVTGKHVHFPIWRMDYEMLRVNIGRETIELAGIPLKTMLNRLFTAALDNYLF